jgi:hypothetical protein
MNPLLQPCQVFAVLIGNPEIRRLEHEHDENEGRNNEVIDDPSRVHMGWILQRTRIHSRKIPGFVLKGLGSWAGYDPYRCISWK